MIAVIQLVRSSCVRVTGEIMAQSGGGLAVLLGIAADDVEEDCLWLADRIVGLRVFPDAGGKMNLNVLDSGGSLLVVPNFTLCARADKGRRPSFDAAMPSDAAEPMFERFLGACRGLGASVQAGVFRSHMLVAIENDGPVTIVLDSRDRPGKGR